MTEDVRAYFAEQYEKSGIRVVPGHWPDFESKEHVDRWLGLLTRMFELAQEDDEEDGQDD